MLQIVLVATGGAIGSACRHFVNLATLRWFGPAFPFGTLAVNVAGSALMGLVVGWFALRPVIGGPELRLFLATGLLGGFTTFSAFTLDAMQIWQRGDPGLAFGYVLASVGLSVAGLAIGLALVRVFA